MSAAAATGLALLFPQDAGGSGSLVHPYRGLAALAVLGAAGIYTFTRIDEERKRTPRWYETVAKGCSGIAIAAVFGIYACWNRKRRVPSDWSDGFWVFLAALTLAVTVFACVRAWLWVRARRHTAKTTPA